MPKSGITTRSPTYLLFLVQVCFLLFASFGDVDVVGHYLSSCSSEAYFFRATLLKFSASTTFRGISADTIQTNDSWKII